MTLSNPAKFSLFIAIVLGVCLPRCQAKKDDCGSGVSAFTTQDTSGSTSANAPINAPQYEVLGGFIATSPQTGLYVLEILENGYETPRYLKPPTTLYSAVHEIRETAGRYYIDIWSERKIASYELEFGFYAAIAVEDGFIYIPLVFDFEKQRSSYLSMAKGNGFSDYQIEKSTSFLWGLEQFNYTRYEQQRYAGDQAMQDKWCAKELTAGTQQACSPFVQSDVMEAKILDFASTSKRWEIACQSFHGEDENTAQSVCDSAKIQEYKNTVKAIMQSRSQKRKAFMEWAKQNKSELHSAHAKYRGLIRFLGTLSQYYNWTYTYQLQQDPEFTDVSQALATISDGQFKVKTQSCSEGGITLGQLSDAVDAGQTLSFPICDFGLENLTIQVSTQGITGTDSMDKLRNLIFAAIDETYNQLESVYQVISSAAGGTENISYYFNPLADANSDISAPSRNFSAEILKVSEFSTDYGSHGSLVFSSDGNGEAIGLTSSLNSSAPDRNFLYCQQRGSFTAIAGQDGSRGQWPYSVVRFVDPAGAVACQDTGGGTANKLPRPTNSLSTIAEGQEEDDSHDPNSEEEIVENEKNSESVAGSSCP